MNSTAAYAQSFVPKPEALQGLVDGTLKRIGSVIYHVAGGIHSHMQETAAFDPGQLSGKMNEVANQLADVSQGLQLVKVAQLANVALTAVDVGVSVVGFVVMNAKLNALRDDVRNVSDSIGLLREERLAEDFLMLSTFLERFEEAWLWRDLGKAEDEWRAIASEARRYQDIFESRARRLLDRPSPAYEMADRMVDALSTIGGLRMSAAMAANEDRLARRIADECGERVIALTGTIGMIDLARSSMASDVVPGSTRWPDENAAASAKAGTLGTKFREREARAATRSAQLSLLVENGITPRHWLQIARDEKVEPILVLERSTDAH